MKINVCNDFIVTFSVLCTVYKYTYSMKMTLINVAITSLKHLWYLKFALFRRIDSDVRKTLYMHTNIYTLTYYKMQVTTHSSLTAACSYNSCERNEYGSMVVCVQYLYS